VELIVQPADGIKPVLKAIESAKKSVDLIIFRFDLKQVEKAVEVAVKRGVAVRALIAHTNSGGEKRLRQLELRMLTAGVSVSRTADDLVRYHGKLLIVDREELYVLGFNFTGLDLRSRSLGLVTRDRRAVQEAVRLFDADASRQDFDPAFDNMVISPENAREQLATFIKRAKKQLVIWDPKVSDPQMIRLINQRAKAGVDVRIIGRIAKRGCDLRSQKIPGRLHVRAMVRDGDTAFVGSQSLRALELDGRREVGLITREPKVVKGILEVFESDWAKTDLGQKELKAGKAEKAEKPEKAEKADKAAKADKDVERAAVAS
jgi:phosphatidylserine/phosphatidylglycerophosphate/cardiolipin synthase-like enzyme